jgi:hypothetical protein
MQPIDRPFRFTLDFIVVWVLLAVPTFLLLRHADIGPWYSQLAALILLPLFATFVLYGPVLLTRQIFRSGSRGGFVGRVFLSILLFAVLVFGGLWVSGYYTELRAQIMAFVFSSVATAYLHLRLRHEPWAQPLLIPRDQ